MASAPIAQAQTLEDLTRLTEATWHLAVTPATDTHTFDAHVRDHYPRATVTDQTAQTLLGWDDVASHWHVELLQFSLSDSIDCLQISAEGLARLRAEPAPSIPRTLAPFLEGGLVAEADAAAYSLCTGILRPPAAFADYDTWVDWYEGLEARLGTAGLAPIRAAASGWDGYVAGLLSAGGVPCAASACVTFAAPYAVALRDLGRAEISITIGAVTSAR
ncbi:MAG: hypothetical protein AAFQ79_07930 [Pseudomonadota bacterium]